MEKRQWRHIGPDLLDALAYGPLYGAIGRDAAKWLTYTELGSNARSLLLDPYRGDRWINLDGHRKPVLLEKVLASAYGKDAEQYFVVKG